MNRLLLLLSFAFVLALGGNDYSQTGTLKTENLFIITIDGFRWQEMFGGITDSILNDDSFIRNTDEVKRLFAGASPQESRKKLLPFIWNEIAVKGQIYGNRFFGNYVNVENKYWFSYPGYNEMFTGYPDDKVDSNDKIPNPNKNVLEYINSLDEFKNRVAVFTSWDVFPYILNRERSHLLINSGYEKFEPANVQITPEMKLLNEMQMNIPHTIGDEVRQDILTFHIGYEYVKQNHPRVVYFGFDETDDYAHQGCYDCYLKQANSNDKWIEELWKYVQSDEQYKDKTTFLILCDHGRGDVPASNWTEHGQEIHGANEIWLAVIGPDIPALGEIKTQSQYYEKQIAPTIASLLGLKFISEHGAVTPISLIGK